MFPSCRLIVVAVLLSLFSTSLVAEDAHDKLVYSRFSRKFQPTAYKTRYGEERVQLDRPATKEDVEAGRAIFSFEGLGEARVWKMAPFPVRYHDKHKNSQMDATAWQAEELKVGDRWKRYYGVLSGEGAAVVPADEWEVYWPDAPWIPGQQNPFSHRPAGDPFAGLNDSPFGGERMGEDRSDAHQLHWCVTIQRPAPGSWIRDIDDPLEVTVHFANYSPNPKKLPAKWTGVGRDGRPAMLSVISLSLGWTPFDPDYPFLRESVELEPRHIPELKHDARTRTVKPDETCQLFTFDLRDWFKIEREGYYKLTVTIWWAGLDFVCPELESEREFTIGRPPRLPTIEQYNEAAFGTPENEERLKQLIRDWAKRETAEQESRSSAVQQLDWSEPVGGLVARIESMGDCRFWWGGDCIVRLKNVSKQPLAVPTGNPCDEGASPLFDLYAQHGAGPWRRVKGKHDHYIAAPSGRNVHPYDNPVVDRPWVTLKPGEDCLSVFYAWNEEDCVVADRFKIVLKQPDTSVPGHWSGALETPLQEMPFPLEKSLAPSYVLPFPDHFPLFSHDYRGYVSQSSDTTAVDVLDYGNTALIELLPLYSPADVRREIERRMHAEKVLAMKLLLASIAAPLGSEDAAVFLLEKLKDTSFYSLSNTRYALSLVCDRCSESGPPDWEPNELPAWLVELCLATISDQRFLTDPYESPSYVVAADFYDPYVLGALALAQCRKAVPTLIEWVESGRDDVILALGEIGGEQAIAALAEMAKERPVREDVIDALCDTRDKQAVPALIEILEQAAKDGIEEKHTHPIWVFGQIGDPRAIPVLVKLLENIDESEGVVEFDRVYERNQLQPPLSTLAKSLGQLKAEEAVSQLLRFVQYPEVIESLGNIGDPAALPALREIVAAKGKRIRNGQPVLPEFEADRYFAARMALCTWDDDRGAARLLDMLAETETVEERRYELVKGLARCNHPSTIPALVDIIKSARGRESIQAAISVLGELKYKAAVEGLIDCFDVDFQEETFGKGGLVTSATYRNAIARSLQKLTRRSFGSDQNQWLQWWQKEGQYRLGLK